MSGGIVSQALRDRFESIRQSEVERLEKKLRGLSVDDRRVVESITSEIVQAIAGVPARVLAEEHHEPALEAVVRLFALERVE
jgi:glutamyl-tRNA reductase